MVSQHEEADAQCGELATHGANEERCPSHCKYEKGCKSAEEHNDGLDSHLRGEARPRPVTENIATEMLVIARIGMRAADKAIAASEVG
jgi:hypothetical protein